MGGTSRQEQTQNSTTNPWEPAQPLLNGILGQLNSSLGRTGLTGAETGALNTLSSNATQGNPNAPAIGQYATNLLNGGGASDQAGAVSSNLNDLRSRLSGQADPNYSSLSDPKLRAALDQIQTDVSGQVNGQFAAAGRDFSGYNQQALSRGVASAQAPLILDQFNRDRTLQQGAAGTLYNAGNTSSGLLSAMNQQGLANQGQGVTASQQAIDAKNSGANQQLAVEAQRRGIPMQALGLLAQLGIPIAGLGGTSSGKTTGTSQLSGTQQFLGIMQGIGQLGNFFQPRSGGGNAAASAAGG